MTTVNHHQMEFINYLSGRYQEQSHIDPANYEKYGVKRGLRNSDGTGVMAGVTLIGNVHGYVVVDGERTPDEGKLFYRGIEVMELADGFHAEGRHGFEEIIYLLLFGSLPTTKELAIFNELLAACRPLPVSFTEDMIIKAPSRDIMNKMAQAVLAMYSYDDNPEDCSVQNMIRQSIELISRFPSIAAHAYAVKKHYFDRRSLHIHYPHEDLSTAENLLRMVRSHKRYTKQEADILDLCLIIHAEHGGGNNSAFACRVLSSSGTDTYSAISSAIGSLKGPKHGGANIKVMQMLEDIQKNVKNWDDDDEVLGYLGKILRKEVGDRSGLIYGIGHAVYTISDPRAVALKKQAESLAITKGMEKEYRLIEAVERLAPQALLEVKDENKVVCANVDLYSGLVYQMLDIPTELFTPIFAIARIAGWAAHRVEEVASGGRIIRPAYKSLVQKSNYVALDQR